MKKSTAIVASSLVLAAFMTGCGNRKIKVNNDKIVMGHTDLVETDKNFSFDTTDSISVLDIDIEIGNINVEYSDSGKTELTLGCKAFADGKDVCNEIISHISAKSEAKDDTLFIRLVEEDTGEEIIEWLGKNIPDCRIELDAHITVPTYMENFSAKVDIGNISLIGLNGSFDTSADVGNITCSGLEVTGSSEIKCNTGNITMNDIIYKADTEMSSVVGNISFDLPVSGSGGADINIHSDTGNIDLSSDGDHTIIDKKDELTLQSMTIACENCKIDLLTYIGNITVGNEE